MEPQLDVAELEQSIQKITAEMHTLEEQFFLVVNREKDLEYHLCEFKDYLKMRKNSLESIPNKKFSDEYEVVAKLEKRVEAIVEMDEIHKEKIAVIKRTMESLHQRFDVLRQMIP